MRIRYYAPADEAAAIALWQRTWQQAYPQLDFAARIDWWSARWRDELVPNAEIAVAEQNGTLIGFVTVERGNGYLDQIVVAPEAWRAGIGAALLDEAKRLSPSGLTLHVNTDNPRAIGFYQKHGFAIAGQDINPRSGAPVHRMTWKVVV